ncbi:MAG: ATPase, T2SS/T4P/T4SS family [Kiritimatiellia bacterium]|jgi:pilus assembly protein CpaF
MTILLQIRDASGEVSTRELPPGNYFVGRGPSCTLRLSDPLVSERHLLVAVQPSGVAVEDMGSSNGTFVNDVPAPRRVPVRPGDRIRLGSHTLSFVEKTEGSQAPGPPPAGREAPAPPAPSPVPAPPSAAAPPPAASAVATSVSRDLRSQIHQELVQRLDIKRLTTERVSGEELQRRARETIDAIVADVRKKLPAGIDPAKLAQDVFNEALRLGPLEDLLADDSVTEIMVNGPHQVFVERRGRIERVEQDFLDDASVLAIIERIVAPLGRRIDESQPYVDARLPDGSRVNAIIAPLSLVGPCLTIRKFSKTPLRDADLIRFGTLTPQMAEFLSACVRMRKNIVVSGGTGSGKTTLLNVLSCYIPGDERIVTIEDAAELRLVQPHLVRLEARPPNIEGRGAITIRDLVRNALRMRPDRIIVGECRGGEALDMLQAMNTGHDGSLTTVHANTPRDVVSRLETMVMMAGMDLPSRAIREQIASAIDIIVHEARYSDGGRRIAQVSEVVGLEGTQVVMQDIFAFQQTGLDAAGKVAGSFRATGSVPTFFQDLAPRGIHLDPAIFQPSGGGAS